MNLLTRISSAEYFIFSTCNTSSIFDLLNKGLYADCEYFVDLFDKISPGLHQPNHLKAYMYDKAN